MEPLSAAERRRLNRAAVSESFWAIHHGAAPPVCIESTTSAAAAAAAAVEAERLRQEARENMGDLERYVAPRAGGRRGRRG